MREGIVAEVCNEGKKETCKQLSAKNCPIQKCKETVCSIF